MKIATFCAFLAAGTAVQAVPISLNDMNNFDVQPILSLVARADSTTTESATPTATGQANSALHSYIKDKRDDSTERANTTVPVSEKVFWVIKDKRNDSSESANMTVPVSEKVFWNIKRADSNANHLNSTGPNGALRTSSEDGSWLFIPKHFTGDKDLNMTVAHNGTLAHSVHVSENFFWLI